MGIMDIIKAIEFLENSDIGMTISVEDADVLKVKMNGKDVDVDILDMDKISKLKEDFKKWKD